MKTSNLIRCSGLALIVGGIIGVLSLVIHPLNENAPTITSSLWVPAHFLAFVSSMLFIFGLIGLYARQAEETGRLGLIGFALTLVGVVALGMELLWIEVIIYPFLVANEPALFYSLRSTPAYLVPIGLSFLLFLGGSVTFGVAMVRAAVLPRWGVWLVILAVFPTLLIAGLFALLFAGITSVFGVSGSAPFFVIFAIFGSALDLSFVGWGYALWSEKPQVTAQS